jgi:hypothetical protein
MCVPQGKAAPEGIALIKFKGTGSGNGKASVIGPVIFRYKFNTRLLSGDRNSKAVQGRRQE